jgi:hypothetical protein
MELSADVTMFALFPTWELQGFLPIAGFNYGGKLFKSEGKCTAFNKIFSHLASLILWLF